MEISLFGGIFVCLFCSYSGHLDMTVFYYYCCVHTIIFLPPPHSVCSPSLSQSLSSTSMEWQWCKWCKQTSTLHSSFFQLQSQAGQPSTFRSVTRGPLSSVSCGVLTHRSIFSTDKGETARVILITSFDLSV